MGGFKVDPVQPEAVETSEGSDGRTQANKKRKGASERDLNPYRSVARVRCSGTVEDGVTPCNKKVRRGERDKRGWWGPGFKGHLFHTSN